MLAASLLEAAVKTALKTQIPPRFSTGLAPTRRIWRQELFGADSDAAAVRQVAVSMGRALWNALPQPQQLSPAPAKNPQRNDACPLRLGAQIQQCCAHSAEYSGLSAGLLLAQVFMQCQPESAGRIAGCALHLAGTNWPRGRAVDRAGVMPSAPWRCWSRCLKRWRRWMNVPNGIRYAGRCLSRYRQAEKRIQLVKS